MDLVLIHGMGRTPLSMLLLRHRLNRLGFNPHLFGYIPALESLQRATDRLVDMLHCKISHRRYALVGHSLGTVIIRNALPHLIDNQPSACFFLAPPMVACKAAKFFSKFWLYQVLTGEMGQLLAQETFMVQLELPRNARIYVGTGGPRASWLPFGQEVNDCILSVGESCGPYTDGVVKVPSTHTFIMSSPVVAKDIAASLKNLAC
ncbi:triacylglycerol lipase [Motiliproteus sp. MSK22-1]|uniref:esterase/lipase family protein n=1 Tax=Motiliproteus sp. MSK22-1 TaxID=1897630 RepID=UPI0009785C71|nr:alpha/beta hydrolase [Motiliproteus sp. MSK22-1]OMH31729.1 hypothetical protein BGP75_16535 [Motiliproteus sp. MSK22-1]